MRPGKIFFIPFFIAAALFAFSAVVMLLWNNILTPVLSISSITFWQAMGIFVLSKILFGFKPFGGSRRHRFGPPHSKRWRNMSSEEKAQFKEAWKQRCESKKADSEKSKESLK